MTVIDYVQSVVGELVPGTVQTRVELQRPEVRIRDPVSGNIVERVRSNVPDLLSLHGLLLFDFTRESITNQIL